MHGFRSIEAILEAIGHPLGRRGRTTCPIHQGDNQQAFSYTDQQWQCWVCGEGGGVVKLLKATGLWQPPPPPPPARPILGLLRSPGGLRKPVETHEQGSPRPTPARRLYEALGDFRRRVDNLASADHAVALDLLEEAGQLLDRGEEYFETAMETMWEGMALLHMAHSRLRTSMLECGCWELIYPGNGSGRDPCGSRPGEPEHRGIGTVPLPGW